MNIKEQKLESACTDAGPSCACKFDALGCATQIEGVEAGDRHVARFNIEQYDFTKIRGRLETEGIIPADQIDTAISEFRKFLIVIVESDGPVGMISPVVDEVWHAFILHTADYAEFSENVFGHFLHHAPNNQWTPSSEDSVPNFVVGYNALFGDLNPIWTMHGHDSTCDGNCNTGCTQNCGSDW